jgi:uncharacterized protein with PQ loop repeat
MNAFILASLNYVGPITFLGLQLSTLHTTIKIYQARSVGTMSAVPFFTLFVNCVVWSLYGIGINAPPIYLFVLNYLFVIVDFLFL